MVFTLLVSVITSDRIAGAITANAIMQFRIARSNRPIILENFMPSRLLNTGITPTFAKHSELLDKGCCYDQKSIDTDII